MPTVKRYFCLPLTSVLLSRYVFSYTLFFYNNDVFPAQAEYSYFSADFRLKIFVYYSYIIAYDISVLEYYKCLVSGSGSRYIVHVLHQRGQYLTSNNTWPFWLWKKYFMYSYQNHTLPLKFNCKFTLQSQIHSYNTRNSCKFRLPFCRTRTKQFSVFYQGPKFYNTLNTNIINVSSPFSFKRALKAFICNNY